MKNYHVVPMRRMQFAKVEGVSNDCKVWTHDTVEWAIVNSSGELIRTGFGSYAEAEQAIPELAIY